MKGSAKHLLISGGIALGAAAFGVLVWWSLTPLPPERPEASDASEPLQSAAGEGGSPIHRTLPTAPPPLPDLDLLFRQATADAGPESSETAARRDEALAEARRRVAEDPKSALAWALMQGEMLRPTLGIVLEAWAQRDPAAAFQAARWIADGDDRGLRDYALLRVAEIWAGKDPVAALSAVETLPSWPAAALLQGRVLAPWAENDPVAAAAGFKKLLSGERTGKDAGILQSTVVNVAARLALQDNARAVEWAMGFPAESQERANAVAGVVSSWYETDAKGVSDWLNRMETGSALDAGTAALVGLSAQAAPGVSLQWAETISNEAHRSAMTAQVAARWLAAEPEKAAAWIRDSKDLTDKQRELILTHSRQLSEMDSAFRQ